MQVNIIIVKDMVQLDIAGPFEVLARVPGWRIDLVAATLDPVRTDRGLTILPTQTRASAKPSDMLVIPGGTGIDDAMLDADWVDYAAREIESARYVFGICTGSLLIAATGALSGRRAGGHWQARDLLERFGVTPSHERMTVDGKFYTSGGVTSGIDMALRVVADVAGEETARRIQLAIEYDPAPPFPGGTPQTSPRTIVDAVLEQSHMRRAAREAKVNEAAARLKARR
ncbi:MAG: DJ-1/PfpI family protein [Pseudorhodoplanes sp.]|nr:DJ-1/PfpI family protein [Pseudorhodoplanes sp.]